MPHADPTGKSRHTRIRKFLVTKRDGRAGGGRVFTLAVAEAGADGEISTVWQAHQ